MLQQKMDAAFDNYLQLTRVLQDDMTTLLDSENGTQQWRRNFIRASGNSTMPAGPGQVGSCRC